MIDVDRLQMFACDECPIIEQFESRMAFATEHPWYGDFQFDHCGCDKVGDEFFICGYCEDAWVDRPNTEQKSCQAQGRAYRRKMTTKKHNRLLKLAKSTYVDSVSVEWDFVDGNLQPVGKHVKFPKNSNRQRFYKRYSNRLFRHGADAGSGKAGYKRCFDYKWEID